MGATKQEPYIKRVRYIGHFLIFDTIMMHVFFSCAELLLLLLLSKGKSNKTRTVVPTKSDSDVILFKIAKYNTVVYISLELTRIKRSLVYKSYPADRINKQVIYRF